MNRDVFHAIADPNRRAILSLLAGQRLPVNHVVEHFGISRPAISRHIKVLAESGLVVVHQQGRQRYCEARLDRLNEVSAWVEQARRQWDGRLDRLDEVLKDMQAK
ncbi:MAG: ArsR/SmtB family transcription factor [Bacteroidota bacterium]